MIHNCTFILQEIFRYAIHLLDLFAQKLYTNGNSNKNNVITGYLISNEVLLKVTNRTIPFPELILLRTLKQLRQNKSAMNVHLKNEVKFVLYIIKSTGFVD